MTGPMAALRTSASRVNADGKFFRLGGKKFYLKGLAYGPFAPNEQQEMFRSREHTARDFQQIRELGYKLYWHRPPLFNPGNYFENRENIFGSVISANMLCIHAGVKANISGLKEVTE